MNTTLLKTGIILLVFIILPPSMSAQNQNSEIHNLTNLLLINSIDDDLYFFDGTISLNNQEILNGEISINHKNEGEYSVIIKTENIRKHIPNKDIDYVKMRRENDTNMTKFVVINDDGKLYREVFTNENNTSLYDTSHKPFDGILIGEVLINDDGNIISTYNFWASGPKKGLINYINKRDGLNYKRSDFKTIQDLFQVL
jgi:hypothetical protein